MSMPLHRNFAISSFAAAVLFVSGAFAEERIALVIGNAAYSGVAQLKNTHNDAKLIAQSFRDVGFNHVTLLFDATRQQIIDALNDFEDRGATADWAVLYYAGHGVEVKGENYLIPVDARPRRDTDFVDQGISLSRLFDSTKPAKTLQLIILDACRDNPFQERTRSVGGRGIGMIEPRTPRTAIAYAASRGQVARDGIDGSNSPYAEALANRLREPGLDIPKLFAKVGDDVMAATGQEQKPAFYSELSGDDFFFRPPEPEVIGPVDPVFSPDTQRIFVIQDSVDPRDFADFIHDYPDSQYVIFAQRKLDRLEPDYWPTVQAADDFSKYKEYLTLYPQGPHAAEAARRVEAARQTPDERVWIAIEASTDPAKFKDFLRDFPNSRHAPDAKRRLATLQAAAEERALWRMASESRNLARVKDYIRRYPDGEFRTEASDLQAALVQEERERDHWNRIAASSDPDDFAAYLTAFPNGKHAAEAEQRRQTLEEAIAGVRKAEAEDDQAWNKVRNSRDPDAIRDYLVGFPEGRHVAEAREGLAGLEPAEPTGRELLKALQRHLKAAGCYQAKIDGLWGNGSQRALDNFIKAAGMNLTRQPTAKVLYTIAARPEVKCAPPKPDEPKGNSRQADNGRQPQHIPRGPVSPPPPPVFVPPPQQPVQRGNDFIFIAN